MEANVSYSPEVIPYLIFMKFSALNAEINIVSSSYNFQIIVFLQFKCRYNLTGARYDTLINFSETLMCSGHFGMPFVISF
jgi:hypothetical protein